MTIRDNLESKQEAALDKACTQFQKENSHLYAFYDMADGFVPGFEMGYAAAIEVVLLHLEKESKEK